MMKKRDHFYRFTIIIAILVNSSYKLRFPFKISIVALVLNVIIFSTSCEEKDEDDPIPFELTAEKVSESQTLLEWTKIENNTGYDIWRTFDASDSQSPELIRQVDSSTTIFVDMIEEDQPLGSPVTYYVTTTTGGTQIQSNEVKVIGRSVWYMHPYQMELIPEETKVLARDRNSLILMDYEKKTVLKRLEFPGRVGQFDIQMRNGIFEVFVPCSDHKIYIHEATSLTPIDTIDTGKSVYALAVNSKGKIFCSGSYEDLVPIYDRETRELVTSVRADNDCGLFLQDDNHLITVTSHLTPAIMSYYTFNDQGVLISKTDNPYNWDFKMDPERTSVSHHYIVTSTDGFVYTADEDMIYLTKLTTGRFYQSDFEFSSDGKVIYSALTNEKAILKSTIAGNTAVSTMLPTHGYPWIIARAGSTMVILSSPESFSPYITSGIVSLETVTLP